MNLIIHIIFEKENEKMCSKLYDKIQRVVPFLGRNEDIALIEDIKLTEIMKNNNRSCKSKNPMYIKVDSISSSHTRFRLPFFYEPVRSYNENRIFNFIDVFYVSEGTMLDSNHIFVDEDNDIVHFLNI